MQKESGSYADVPSLTFSGHQMLTTPTGVPFLAFAKATTPLHEIGLYEEIIEPSLAAGRLLVPSLCLMSCF